MTSEKNRAKSGRSQAVQAIEVASFTAKDVPSSFWASVYLAVALFVFSIFSAFEGGNLKAGSLHLLEVAESSRLTLPSIDAGMDAVRQHIDKSAVAIFDAQRRGFSSGVGPVSSDLKDAASLLGAYTTGKAGGRPPVAAVVDAETKASITMAAWSVYLYGLSIVSAIIGGVLGGTAFASLVSSFARRYQIALSGFRRDETARKEFTHSMRIALQSVEANAAGSAAFVDVANQFNSGFSDVVNRLNVCLDEVSRVKGERDRVGENLLKVREEFEALKRITESGVNQVRQARVMVADASGSSKVAMGAIATSVSNLDEAVMIESRASTGAQKLNELVFEASRGVKRMSESVEDIQRQLGQAGAATERINYLAMNANIAAERSKADSGLREISSEATAVYERLRSYLAGAESMTASYISDLRAVAFEVAQATQWSTESLSDVAALKAVMHSAAASIQSLHEVSIDLSTNISQVDESLKVVTMKEGA